MPEPATTGEAGDLGEYCRQVEAHLARVNAGHLVRIFGAGFDLVRSWHERAVPLSVVLRGIEQKAERHRSGQSKRPLRLEFCAPDVESLFDDWRRAVGVERDAAPGPALNPAGEAESASAPVPAESRRTSVARQLDRAIQKLALTTGRLDAPEAVQAETSRILDALSALREASKRARGEARARIASQAREIDADIGRLARLSGASIRGAVETEAALELQPFRLRLKPDHWQQSLDANVDRLLRARYGLPVLDLHLEDQERG